MFNSAEYLVSLFCRCLASSFYEGCSGVGGGIGSRSGGLMTSYMSTESFAIIVRWTFSAHFSQSCGISLVDWFQKTTKERWFKLR